MGHGGARDARTSRLAYWILHLVPAGLLMAALDPWPHGYYTVLRFVVSLAAAWLAYLIYRRDHGIGAWSIVFASAAVLFNPVLPVDVPRTVWIFYVATAALFVAHFIATRAEPMS